MYNISKQKLKETLPKVDLNVSFLTKLPEDIRMEVIENFDQQQRDLNNMVFIFINLAVIRNFFNLLFLIINVIKILNMNIKHFK